MRLAKSFFPCLFFAAHLDRRRRPAKLVCSIWPSASLNCLTIFLIVWQLSAQASPSGWQAEFAGPGIPGGAGVLAVHDGQLVAGGEFDSAGKVNANGVAAWDGLSWQQLLNAEGLGLQPNEPPQTMRVSALASFNGSLYVSGTFTHAGGKRVDGLARWDGTDWWPIGNSLTPGVDGRILVMAVWSGQLLFGGDFSGIAGVDVDGLASWNGTEISEFAGGSLDNEGVIRTMEVVNGELYVGGNFSAIDGEAVSQVARWTGEHWQGFSGQDGEIQGIIYDIEFHQGELYVVGSFDEIGDNPLWNIARWDGSEWRALIGPDIPGGPPDGNIGLRGSFVQALASHNGLLFAGGDIAWVDDRRAHGMAAWTGTDWLLPEDSNQVTRANRLNQFLNYNGELLVASAFGIASDSATVGIARLTADGWTSLEPNGGSGASSWVTSLATLDNELIAGGNFSHIGGVEANFIARWNGDEWLPLAGPESSGLNENAQINDIIIHAGNVIVGGDNIDQAGGIDVRSIARWTGKRWYALESDPGSRPTGEIVALNIYKGDLIATGRFGGSTYSSYHIGRWDGEAWHPLRQDGSNDFDRAPDALHVHDNWLYVAGSFSQVGEITVAGLARWNGNAWSAVPGWDEFDQQTVELSAIASFRDELIVGGEIRNSQGFRSSILKRWDGEQWHLIPDNSGNAVKITELNQLFVHNDQLIAGGWLRTDQTNFSRSTARWDGISWRGLSGPLTTGTSLLNQAESRAYAFGEFQGDLIVGGNFSKAGGIPAWHIGRYVASPFEVDIISELRTSSDPGQPVTVRARIHGSQAIPDGGMASIHSSTSRYAHDGPSCSTLDLQFESSNSATFECTINPDRREWYRVNARFRHEEQQIDVASSEAVHFVRLQTMVDLSRIAPDDIQAVGQPVTVFARPVSVNGQGEPDGQIVVTSQFEDQCVASSNTLWRCRFWPQQAGTLELTAEYQGSYFYSQSSATTTYQIEPPRLVFDPPSLDFGQVQIPDGPFEGLIGLVNVSDTVFQVDNLVQIRLQAWIEPTTAGTCGSLPFTLEPDQSCTLGYRFDPTVIANYRTEVRVESDNLPGLYFFTVQGQGLDDLFRDSFEGLRESSAP